MHRFSTGWRPTVTGMSETQPIGSEQPPQDPAQDPPREPDEPVTSSERPRFRERVFGLWTLLAVAVAGLLLGAVVATGVGALVDHGRPDHLGPGPGMGRGFEGGPGGHHGFRGGPEGPPPGAPGQVPPSSPPSDEPTPNDSGATPDTSTGSNT